MAGTQDDPFMLSSPVSEHGPTAKTTSRSDSASSKESGDSGQAAVGSHEQPRLQEHAAIAEPAVDQGLNQWTEEVLSSGQPVATPQADTEGYYQSLGRQPEEDSDSDHEMLQQAHNAYTWFQQQGEQGSPPQTQAARAR